MSYFCFFRLLSFRPIVSGGKFIRFFPNTLMRSWFTLIILIRYFSLSIFSLTSPISQHIHFKLIHLFSYISIKMCLFILHVGTIVFSFISSMFKLLIIFIFMIEILFLIMSSIVNILLMINFCSPIYSILTSSTLITGFSNHRRHSVLKAFLVEINLISISSKSYKLIFLLFLILIVISIIHVN